MSVHVDPIFLQKTKKSKFAGIIMYTTLIIGSDQIQIEIAWVWELGFAQQERKRRGGRTWRVLVAGEGPEDRGLGTAAAATAKSSPPKTDRAHTRGTGERRERTEARPQGRRFWAMH